MLKAGVDVNPWVINTLYVSSEIWGVPVFALPTCIAFLEIQRFCFLMVWFWNIFHTSIFTLTQSNHFFGIWFYFNFLSNLLISQDVPAGKSEDERYKFCLIDLWDDILGKISVSPLNIHINPGFLIFIYNNIFILMEFVTPNLILLINLKLSFSIYIRTLSKLFSHIQHLTFEVA